MTSRCSSLVRLYARWVMTMSDDTREHAFESVLGHQISADDPSIDMLATVTITIERNGHKQEIEFKAEPRELECDMETFIDIDESLSHFQMVRVQRQSFKFNLNARPISDPQTGVAYTITRTPPG